MGLLTQELDVEVYDLHEWDAYMNRADYQDLKRAIQQLLDTRLDGHDRSFEVWFDVAGPNDYDSDWVHHIGYKVILDKVIKDVDLWNGTVWSPADTDDILISLFQQIESATAFRNDKYKFQKIIL